MIGFELLRPGLAWLLLLPPLAFLAGWLALGRSRAELEGWVAESKRVRFLPGFSRNRARLRLALAAAGTLFLALALLGPVRGHTWRAVSRRGLDLVVCLDTSRSMLAQDLRPSRLERAKREIRGLLDHLGGDRVALVAFSGDARDITPLTRDRGTLAGLLAHVTPDDNQMGGTDLAAALARALALFDGRTGAHEAIVLLTDGEDLGGQGMQQAEEAARRGIRVFVVGLGTEAGGKIPVSEPGGRSGFLKDEDGQEVVTRLERGTLVALTERTGGAFLSAEEAPTALEDLYRARVSRLQGREIEGGERRVPYDRFQWPLALAVLCFGLELLVRVQRPRRAAAADGARLAAALLPLVPLGPVQTEPFASERALAEAVRAHAARELDAAEAAARAVLDQAGPLALPERDLARAHFALGLVQATRALEHPEAGEPARAEARAAFAAARALAGPGELRNDATYDLGALELLRAEEVRATLPELGGNPAPPAALPGAPGPDAGPPADPLEEARALYQAARGWLVERLRLDWRDEDTRANLELVQRRLKELDQIEQQREQQEQEQQQEQQQDQQGQDPESKDQESKDQQDPSEQEGDPQEGEPDKGDPEKKEPGEGEPEEQPPQDPSEQQAPEQPPETPEEGAPEEQQAPPPPGASEERVLTREEVMRLLDKLAELEEKQKALEAALRARQRAKTKRDW
ncbi:MAG TPA: VWA domain-containing protein [Planctomycetota bacterium]